MHWDDLRLLGSTHAMVSILEFQGMHVQILVSTMDNRNARFVLCNPWNTRLDFLRLAAMHPLHIY